MLAQYIVARQEFYLYGVCVGYRNVWNRTKRIAGNLPGTDGGQTAPASFTHGRPAPSLRPNQPSRAASMLRRDMRECSRAGAFGAFSNASRSLPPWPGAVHTTRRFPPRPWGAWSRPTPSARGSKRGCQNPFYHPPQHGTLGEVDHVRRTGLVQVKITIVSEPVRSEARRRPPVHRALRWRPKMSASVNSLTTKPPPAERSSRP